MTTNSPQEPPVQLTPRRIHQIREKYDALFWRQPNVQGVGEGNLRDAQGEKTGKTGIVVMVTKKVAQSTLPTADRIPACLEGVPVEIREQSEGVHYAPSPDPTINGQNGETNDD